ncbi:hypothetical protein VBApiPXC38_80 [Acinetobacter phage VB_ApiP_XC38]|uniref:Uncharacterized protein n=1 Tax=Acinetobacter phage VB_ApiP_XC38 TaxID=2655002 RepID=A0A5P8PR47_9CAUD|nr:hypothetical protein KNU81_gp80 [Acinetobacter phage VB_ApiP_XC38]QFR59767.1 hypothetical protein VBApiPXC38_80 [Acinetobacter phage VB_ApiP_XC38]
MNIMKYTYIGIPMEKYVPEELMKALGDNPYPDVMPYDVKSDYELMLYSLTTGNLSANFISLRSILGIHLVDTNEELASYILAHRLGADLRGLFNGDNKDSTSTNTST